jgi:hypothetical protein
MFSSLGSLCYTEREEIRSYIERRETELHREKIDGATKRRYRAKQRDDTELHREKIRSYIE